MAVTPTGGLSKPLDTLADMISESATWQTLTGEPLPVDAKTYVHLEAFNATAANVTNDENSDEIKAARPICVVSTGEAWDHTSIAIGTNLDTGQIVMSFEIDVPTEYQKIDNLSEAMMDFQNKIGALVSEIMALSDSGTFLHISSISLKSGPFRTDEDQAVAEGDSCFIELNVSWGWR